MFVCTGNICRSPLAHGVFEQMVQEQGLGLQFFVESSGTDSYHVGEEADGRMRRTAAQHGYSFSHRAARVTPEDLKKYDVIFGMDQGHVRQLKAMAQPEDRKKIYLYRDFDPEGSGNVPDPYYGGDEGFEEVFAIIHRTSSALIEAFQNYELP